MSAGQDRYEERRRLEAENELLRLQRENSRLRSEAMADELLRQVHAFFTGKTFVSAVKGPGETYEVWFCAAEPEKTVTPTADQGGTGG